MTLARMLLLGLITVSAGGCSGNNTGDDPNIQQFLNSARAQWNGTGVTTYSFTMLRSCVCTGGTRVARVDVVNGSIASLTDPVTGAPISAPNDTLFRTFPGLFDFAQDALDRDPDRMTITWQSQLGHLVKILVNFEIQTVEDDIDIQVSDVSVATL